MPPVTGMQALANSAVVDTALKRVEAHFIRICRAEHFMALEEDTRERKRWCHLNKKAIRRTEPKK